MKYTVTVPVSATALFHNIEANSEEEAIEKVLQEHYSPTVCCQCSNEVEIGEFYDEDMAQAFEEEE